QLTALDIAGFALRNVGIDASVADGALRLATTESTLLDDGSLVANIAVDLTDLDRLPAKIALQWNGGKLDGGTTQWLRYAMPLFAGLDADVADVVGTVGLELSLDGPAMMREGQEWVTWLDDWQGKGTLGLTDTAFAPATELGGLLAPLGPLGKSAAPVAKDGRLEIASFTAPFSFAKGTVESQRSEWQTSGKSIGLSGTTTLAGALDYTIDLTPLLRGERDGEKVLKALGGSLPATRLKGSLEAPSLELPELGDIASKLLQNEGKNLLEKGLNELFGGKQRRD
ncbi:MAG TPA: hypothetical protein ENI87_00025, partial [bacterium]|nr:hypothetical protein [bacterium]